MSTLDDAPVLSTDPTTRTALLLMAEPGPAAEQHAHGFGTRCFANPSIVSCGPVVENGIAPVDVNLGSRVLKRGSWFVRVRAEDEAQWSRLQQRVAKTESTADEALQREANTYVRLHPGIHSDTPAHLAKPVVKAYLQDEYPGLYPEQERQRKAGADDVIRQVQGIRKWHAGESEAEFMESLQRWSPGLYADYQKVEAAREAARKADIAALGRQDLLQRMEARVQEFINSHRPTPTRTEDGAQLKPTGPVPSKADAWNTLWRSDKEFQRLLQAYYGR